MEWLANVCCGGMWFLACNAMCVRWNGMETRATIGVALFGEKPAGAPQLRKYPMPLNG